MPRNNCQRCGLALVSKQVKVRVSAVQAGVESQEAEHTAYYCARCDQEPYDFMPIPDQRFFCDF